MLSKEEMGKLSERELAAEYIKIMGKGPQRIKADTRDARIAEMLDKLQADADAPHNGVENPATTEGDAVSTKPKRKAKAKAPRANGEGKKKERAPRRAAAEFKTPKEGNPFRDGTMKAKLFDYFVQVKGEREKVITQGQKLGATPATCTSWFSQFSQVCR